MKKGASLIRRSRAVQAETIGFLSTSLYITFSGHPKPILNVSHSLCFKSDLSTHPQYLGRLSLVIFA